MKLEEVKLEKKEIYKSQMKDKTKESKDIIQSATEDCGVVAERYETKKKKNKNPKFPLLKYKKPPHH